jgi:ADP-heptose:LPS heptosyltransferase
VLITGSPGERGLAEAVAQEARLPVDRVLAGRTDLGELCDLVAGAGLVVSGDTGIAHLASAYGTPSVVLFGSVPPSAWGPPPLPRHVALWAGRRGDPHGSTVDPGLLRLSVDDVLAALDGLATEMFRQGAER